ncbi:hypothetical protein SAY87_016323 [Trapa incisa]|uniref:Copper transport protein n=1 Tax=Trapa incisa TaxID=236973 RepID=A0AAN7LH87_9MYRT|nr:hypothetical protein SAY87_016323 [Trapa incisa]
MEGMGNMSNTTTMTTHKKRYLHMTFFWGKDSEILFTGWPATRTGMYVLALLFCFSLALLIEWISHCKHFKLSCGGGTGRVSCSSPPSRGKRVTVGLVQVVAYGLRVGLAYLVMLALMSFNGGVLLVIVAAHAVGYFLFASRAFKAATAPPPADPGKAAPYSDA